MSDVYNVLARYSYLYMSLVTGSYHDNFIICFVSVTATYTHRNHNQVAVRLLYILSILPIPRMGHLFPAGSPLGPFEGESAQWAQGAEAKMKMKKEAIGIQCS